MANGTCKACTAYGKKCNYGVLTECMDGFY